MATGQEAQAWSRAAGLLARGVLGRSARPALGPGGPRPARDLQSFTAVFGIRFPPLK